MTKKSKYERVPFSSLCQWTPRQKEALRALKSGKRFLLYGGALGGGKSFFLRWLMLRRLLQLYLKYDLKNVTVMLACEDYPSLKDRQLQKIEFEFPAWIGAMRHDHKVYGRAFVLNEDYGGGAICFRNLDDPSKYQCFHPETEILTSEGWRQVADVKQGDSVATMNPATRHAEYRDVTKAWEYDFDGHLECLVSRGAPAFAVTPNHTIWASTKRCPELKPYRADELPATAKIPQWAASWSCQPPRDSHVQFKSPGNNGRLVRFELGDFMEFMGWYIAEGGLDPAPRYAIRISQVQESGRARIAELLDRNTVNYHMRPREINFNNRALNEYLAPLKKSHDKHIPRELMHLGGDLLWRMLWSLVEADGTWVSSETGHFVSASRQLADDVSELALRCGLRPTVTLRHDKPGQNNYGDGHKPRYHVHLTRKASDTFCGQHRRQERYKGKVYCVTVPPHHTVLTRYKGRVSWSGNSAEFAAVAVDELTKNTYDTFTHLRSRLRWPGLPDDQTWFIAGTNPGGIGHAWCKQLWIDKVFPEEWTEPIDYRPMFSFIQSKADDNPHLDAAYWGTLQTLPPNLRAAFRDGSWDVFIGQAFPGFTRETHTFRWDGKVPDNAPLYSTFDWGYGKPFSYIWWYCDADGRLFAFAEWYGWNGVPDSGLRLPDSEIAKGVIERERELGIAGRPITRLAGHDSWNKKPDYQGGGQGPSTAEVFAEEGLYLVKADPSRALKLRQFRERIRTREGEPPMLLVATACAQILRTLPNLIMDKNNVEDVDTDGEDHIFDSMCQVAMARPLSLVPPKKAPSPTEALWDAWTQPAQDFNADFFGDTHLQEDTPVGTFIDTL